MRNYACVAAAALAVILSAGAQAGDWFGSDSPSQSDAAPDTRRADDYATLAGKWTLRIEGDDHVCDLTLKPEKFVATYGASTSIGCPDSLFGVSSWQFLGDQIRLVAVGGRILARLHPAQRGWRGTTADGVAIFISRS